MHASASQLVDAGSSHRRAGMSTSRYREAGLSMLAQWRPPASQPTNHTHTHTHSPSKPARRCRLVDAGSSMPASHHSPAFCWGAACKLQAPSLRQRFGFKQKRKRRSADGGPGEPLYPDPVGGNAQSAHVPIALRAGWSQPRPLAHHAGAPSPSHPSSAASHQVSQTCDKKCPQFLI